MNDGWNLPEDHPYTIAWRAKLAEIDEYIKTHPGLSIRGRWWELELPEEE